MPKGVTKAQFKKFAKYYDTDVFIEAGRIIRQRAKSYDSLDPIERAEKIALLFGTFKNPDKETVLTPWRVVNMQMVKTFGGYNFFDDDFEHNTIDGSPAGRFIWKQEGESIYNPQSKVLDINTKEGLHALFVAVTIYERELWNKDGRFNPADIWSEVLENNIYAVAKTPMAKTITLRTLCGYDDKLVTNVTHIPGLVEIIKATKDGLQLAASQIKEVFGNVNFDAVIGNPPYQEETAKKETENGQKAVTNIFQYFQLLANEVSSGKTCLIYPGARWIHRSGKGMKTFGFDQINSPHLSKVIYYPEANEIFTDVGIHDGISIVFCDKLRTNEPFEYVYQHKGESYSAKISTPGESLIPLNPLDGLVVNKIESFVQEQSLKFLSAGIYPQKLFAIESDFAERNPSKVQLYTGQPFDSEKTIKLFTNDKAGKIGRATWFLADRDVITVNQQLVDEWQVVVSSANAGGAKKR